MQSSRMTLGVRMRLVVLGGILAALLLAVPEGTSAESGRILGWQEDPVVELGRRLFFDPAVSLTGAHSCAQCHDPSHGFSDPRVKSEDQFGTSIRHSQTLIDAHHGRTLHWDGEFSSMEELVTQRLSPPVTSQPYYGAPSTPGPTTPRLPGTGRRGRVVTGGTTIAGVAISPVPAALEAGGVYWDAFRAAYGSGDITMERIAGAIGAYCRSIESGKAPFDRWRAGDDDAVSESAKRGFALFKGRAGCVKCHTANGRHPLFSDYKFHNTGVSYTANDRALTLSHGEDHGRNILAGADVGRSLRSGNDRDVRQFKTPSLRDVASRPPYMHDGAYETLEEVVRYYVDGGGNDPKRDRKIRPFRASDQDVADLVAFLETLSSDRRPGMPDESWTARVDRQRIRIVDAAGNGLPNWKVRLEPAGDLAEYLGEEHVDRAPLALEVETDEFGWFVTRPSVFTHVRVRGLDGMVPIDGGLVPDTCKRATIKMPLAGKAKVTLLLEPGVRAPERLKALHWEDVPGAAGSLPAMRFERVGLTEISGAVVARYEGWVSTDLSKTVVLTIPGFETGFRRQLSVTDELRIDLRD